MLTGKRILLIISGGIAAYKALELIRLMGRADAAAVRCILTRGGAQFITPLSVAALSGHLVYEDLFSLKDESEMGHIRLSREADLIVVAPASADILSRVREGRADDLAAAVLLASDKPILLCPAMNPAMWANPATLDNIQALKARGFLFCGPAAGDTACGELGLGRMAEPADILAAIDHFFFAGKPLAGKRAVVTSGPTFEPIDPVRFLGNRSSGRQGHAIARALAEAGACVTLVHGPVSLPDPPGVKCVPVETARGMLDAVLNALPADIAVCAAAVADWRPETEYPEKLKKRAGGEPPVIRLVENPDILKTLSRMEAGKRPGFVVGFAAETSAVLGHAQAKLAAKGCDLLLANNVADGAVFGAAHTHLHALTKEGASDWGVMDKDSAARKLVETLLQTGPIP